MTINLDGLVSNPSTPAANRVKLFARNDILFFMDDTGAVFSMAAGTSRVSVSDIRDPSSELAPLSGVASGDLIIAFEPNVGSDDLFTVYAWDPNPGGAQSVPFTVDGADSGRWIAIAGRFQHETIESDAAENFIRFFFATFGDLPAPSIFHGMFAHVHDPSDDLLGMSAYYAHASSWRMLKDHNADDEVTLTPAASVDIDFGKNALSYQALTLDQNTTLTESNAIAGQVRLLRISSGTPGQGLTFPANWTVFGEYDSSGGGNLIQVECVSPSVAEIQAGGAPAAAYIATVSSTTRGRGNSQTGLSDSATGLLTVNGGDPSHLDIKDSQGQIENRIDPSNIFPDKMSWSGLANITLPNIATTPFTDVYIVETAPGSGVGTFLLDNTPLTATTGRTRIYLGTIIHQSGTVIEQILTIPILSYDSASSLVDLFTQFGDKNNSGNLYSANGTNRLLNKSSGSVFGRQINILVASLQPHTASTASQVSITPYTFSRRNGVGGFVFSSELDVDTDFFDDGSGTLAAIPAGRFVHYPIHFDPRSAATIIEYGQTTYATLNEAIDGINQGFIFNGLIGNIEITTWLIVEGGNSDLSDSAVTQFRAPLEHAVSPSGTLSHDVLTDVTSDQHHPQVHTIVSHDTTATGANLDTLTDGSSTTLHSHPGGGGSTLFSWDFSTNTTEADPGTGNFRFDSATPASVTRIYIDSFTSNGLNLDNFFSDLEVGEEIGIQQADDPTKVILFETTAVTDNSGWWRLDVTVISAAGTLFQNNRQCVFVFHTGNAPVDHDDLTNVTANQHHPQLHASDHSDGSGDEITVENLSTATVVTSAVLQPNGAGGVAFSDLEHSELTVVTPNQHHNEDHASRHLENAADELIVENLGSDITDTSTTLRPDGTGGLAFSDVSHDDLTTVTSDQHHAQLHAAAHAENAADELLVENLGATSTDTSAALRPDGTGGLAFLDVSHGDLTGITVNQHHNEDHASRHSENAADEILVENLGATSTNLTQILRPDGTGGVEFISPVKEIYQNIGYSSFKNSYRVRAVASNASANISFSIPNDFISLVSLELIGFTDGTISGVDIDLASDYAAIGESNTNHTETDTTSTYSFTADIMTATDISAVFSSLSAGDKCGLLWDNNGIGTTLNMLGIRLIYNA